MLEGEIQDETRQLIPSRAQHFGAWTMHGEITGLSFCTSPSICKLAVDGWRCDESARVPEPRAAALCHPLPITPRPSGPAWLPPPSSES